MMRCMHTMQMYNTKGGMFVVLIFCDFLGNIVLLWEKLAELAGQGEMLVELGSDQTSCHNPFMGGYYPVQLTYSEAREMMSNDPAQFKMLVHER